MANPWRKAKGRPAQHSVKPSQRSLVEKGKEGAHGGENRNQLVKLMFKNQEGRHLPQLPVSQEYGQVFQNEHEQITSNAEGNFGEHRVGVRVPESEPCAQGLPDVHHQDRHGAAIANQAHHHRAVQDGFEVFLLEDVNEEAGEEGAGAHGDHSQI